MLKLRGRTVDGVNYPISTRDIITVWLDSMQTSTIANNNSVKINLNKRLVIGNKLSLNTTKNAVIIGNGVSKVMVSATLDTEPDKNLFVQLQICKNEEIEAVYSLQLSNAQMTGLPIPPKIIQVNQGDEITLRLLNTLNSATHKIRPERTYLTVEVVEYS